MRRTRLGTLLLALGWSCFPLALAAQSFAPALLGVMLVALALGARSPAPVLRVARQVPARVVSGEPFALEATAEDPGQHPLFVEQSLPPGVRVRERQATHQRGRSTLQLRLVADDPGLMRWPALHVRYQDAWGVFEDATHAGGVALTEVAAASADLVRGRRAGAAVRVAGGRRDPRGHETEPEIERLRDHQPGDRLRDIDWAQTSRLGRLISRELRREARRPVVILLHAARSARRRRRHSKLATMTRASLAVLAGAEANGAQTGLIAWSERGLEAQVRIGAGRRVAKEAVERLASLPEALPYEGEQPVASPATRRVSAEERIFLSRVSMLSARPAATPTEAALAALARVCGQPCIVFAFLDVEETPRVVPALLARLRHRGHHVVILAPASGAHHYRRAEVDDEALARLEAWRSAREEAAAAVRRHQASLVLLGPTLDDAAVREVLASAQ